ncbi:ATP-binding protein [Ancylothrix sp. C2]|uniref:ATP-binding protein n=1 Tax=Ancylothrix sp. D3o TaxID=2953691 RepID=UPI0021BB0997|nr:ATP-binding protein [Ancylothrix sp. D3o]MCT7950574.1 ATP-binding protein [Ancylothrix sp. D3o]
MVGSKIVKFNLRTVLIVPFVLQTLAAVGLVGYFSYKNGQQAVEDLANQLMNEVSGRITDRLDRYFEAPHQVIEANRLAVEQETLNIKDFEQLRKQFWQQMIVYQSISSITFWNEQQEYISYARIHSEEIREQVRSLMGHNATIGSRYLSKMTNAEAGLRKFYSVDSFGNPEKLLYTLADDFRKLPWYRHAKAVGKQTWTPIFVYRAGLSLGMIAAMPVYDRGEQLQGFFTSDVPLGNISTFLNQLRFSRSGKAFIIERSGDLVATSTLEKAYYLPTPADSQRLPMLNSQDRQTREIAEQLASKFGFENLQQPKKFSFVSSNGERQFVQIFPYRDRFGLDWIMIITVPESDFMGRINDNTRLTILLCFATFMGAIVIGILTARWITRPILRLNAAAKNITFGEFQGNIPVMGAEEVGELTVSFNRMAQSLKESFEALKESHKKFSTLLEAVPIGVSVFDAKGQIIVVNNIGRKILDKGVVFDLPAAAISQAYQIYKSGTNELYPAEELPAFRALAGEIVVADDLEVRRSDGVVIPLEVRASPVFNKEGVVIYTINAFVDISERRKTQQILADYNRTLEAQVQDRTEALQRSESQIEASKAKLNDILNNAIAAISSLRVFEDENWEIAHIAAGCEAISGYTSQELIADKDLWASRIVREDWQAVSEVLYADIFAERTGNYEYRFLHKDGSLRWISQTNNSRWDEGQNGWIVTVISLDITARKGAEIALREALEREKTMRQVTQKMRETFDLDTIFRTVTEELRQTLGCSRVSVYRFFADYSGEFIAESVAEGWVPLVGDNIKQVWEDSYLQETQGGRYRYQETLAVKDIYNAGLTDCHIKLLEQFQARSFSVVPVAAVENLWGLLTAYQNNMPRDWKEPEVQMLAQVGIQLGVAVQQAELFAKVQNQSLQLQEAVEAANAASFAKSAFLANMSHELRTPLNAILGFAQLMSDSQDISEEHRENIGIINRSGEHLLTLINDVLDMAKIEANRTTVYEESFNLFAFLNDLEKMFSLRGREQNLQLMFSVGEQVPEWVRTDEIKLRQVLINLMGNAMKFTKDGGVCLRVGVGEFLGLPVDISAEAEEEKQRIEKREKIRLGFEIEDTGCGIPERELERIFEPFLQTRTGQKSQEGTGLGLPISRKFVEMMGGKMTVSSQVGSGSIFKFDIEVGLVESGNQDVGEMPRRRAIGLAANQPDYRILIVDDEWNNRQLLVKLLCPLGFKIKEAKDGSEALKLWQKWEPQIIFMDMRMAGMHGLEATRLIRAREAQIGSNLGMGAGVVAGEPKNSEMGEQEDFSESSVGSWCLLRSKTVIVAVTAGSFEAEKRAMLEVGCDEVICKPFRDLEILESLSKHLGVSYVWESKDPEKVSVITNWRSLNSADFTGVNAGLVDRLEIATIRASLHEIYEVIDEISLRNVQLAAKLKGLADNFDYTSILKAIEISRTIKE